MQAGPEQGASLPLAGATDATGARRYTPLRRLAVGGMGELWLARADSARGVRKLVVLKRVRSEYASDEEFLKMFVNEARLAATLDHPNIVRTYDLVEDAGGFFMVMEYLHGEPLGRLLNATASAGQRVPLPHVLTIVLGVAAGLHHAHEARGVDGRPLDIVHRDISPGNVFLTEQGGVKLLDFGIAKATSRTSITLGPSRKGKVAYMSPEQCVGHEIDRRSDVFALGIVAWELCTGRRLFRGDNEFAIMNQITSIDAPSACERAPELPAALGAILARALRRDPAERYPTAMALHDALEALATAEGLVPSPTALGRYLVATCGPREPPSCEPDDGLAPPAPSPAPAASMAAATLPTAAARHRLTVPLALVGGVTIGVAVAAVMASSPPAPAASGAAAGPAPTVPARPSPAAPARDDATTTTTTTTPAPTVAPAPHATTSTPPEATAGATPDPAPRATRRTAARRRSTPSQPEPASKPERGVDGILPSG